MKLRSSSYYEYFVFGRNNKKLSCSFENEFNEPLELEKNLLTQEVKITLSGEVSLRDVQEALAILEKLEAEFYND